jgi:hypothetical protein
MFMEIYDPTVNPAERCGIDVLLVKFDVPRKIRPPDEE